MAESTKTEKEKMLSGELYFAFEPQLTAERIAAHSLVDKLNATGSDETGMAQRRQLMAELFTGCYFKELADYPFIESPFRCDYGSNIIFGRNVYLNFNTTILDCAKVEIGDNTLFGPNISLYPATHPTDAVVRAKGLEYALPIKIGRNCWLGGGVTVLPGVTIGDNTTIGAGSVVTKNIPPNCVAVGNPARVIKQLPPPDQKELDQCQMIYWLM